MRLTKHWGAGSFVALLLGLVTWGLWPSAIAVDVAEVGRGPLRSTIDEEGETRVRDRFVISAPVPGRVLRVEIEPGDVVEAGAVVVTLKPAPPAPLDSRARAEARAHVAAARAVLDRANAARDQAATELAQAETELRRCRELDAARLLAGERLDAAKAEASIRAGALRGAEADVQAARQELKAAEAILVSSDANVQTKEAIDLRAPVTGTVLRRLRESESIVPAGEPLIEIGDMTRLEIVSDLLSTDAVRVSPGQRVQLRGWGGGTDLSGAVRRVEPSGFTKVSALGVEEQRVNVVIDLADPAASASRLGDGYRVAIQIVVWEAADVVKIPISSLFRDGDRWQVFVVERGKAVPRTVDIGERNSVDAEVRRGLSPGERVIVHPPDSVEAGGSVTARP